MTNTVTIISQIILLIFAVWLLCVAYYALSSPAKAKTSMGKFGSTPFIHFGEHILRSIVGLAFIGASQITQHPRIFTIIGAFLAGSSLLIMILPRKWHHKYAIFWADKMPVPAIRVSGIIAILAAAILIKFLPIAAISS